MKHKGSVVVVALLAAALNAFAVKNYTMDDKDSEGIPYNTAGRYVTLTNKDDTTIGNAGSSFFNGKNWSDGLAPTSDKDYYTSVDPLYLEVRKDVDLTFAGKSLTIGSWSGLLFWGVPSWHGTGKASDYPVTFQDLRIRANGKFMSYWDYPIVIRGKLTALTEEVMGDDYRKRAPSLASTASTSYFVEANLVGAEGSLLQFISYRPNNEVSLRGYLSGDNSGFLGSVLVGARTEVYLGSDLANGTLETTGRRMTYSTDDSLTPDATHSYIGVSRTDGAPVRVKSIVMAANSCVNCAMIATNGVGFKLDSFTHAGKVKLDMKGMSLLKSEVCIFVAADGENPIDFGEASDYELVNCTNAEVCEVEVSLSKGIYACVKICNTELAGEDEDPEINPDEYATLTARETPSGNDYKTYAYLGASNWTNPEGDPAPGYNYLVQEGQSIKAETGYALYKTSAGRNDSEFGVFAGDSLTFADGSLFLVRGEVYSTEVYYRPRVNDLRMMGGSCLVCDPDTGWSGVKCIIVGEGNMTVYGNSLNPVHTWTFVRYDTQCGKGYCTRYFNNNLCGNGVLRVSGSAVKTNTSGFETEFNGSNEAFTGKLIVGDDVVKSRGTTDVSMSTYTTFGDVKLRLGASGLASGSLIFESAIASLGISSFAENAYVPVGNLTLSAGLTIDAATMITNNASYGFDVLGKYVQKGLVTIDLGGQPVKQERLNILRVPEGTEVDPASFTLANASNVGTGYALRLIETSAGTVLSLCTEEQQKAREQVELPPAGTRFAVVTTGQGLTEADIDRFEIRAGALSDQYRLFIVPGDGGADDTMYVEDMACDANDPNGDEPNYDYQQVGWSDSAGDTWEKCPSSLSNASRWTPDDGAFSPTASYLARGMTTAYTYEDTTTTALNNFTFAGASITYANDPSKSWQECGLRFQQGGIADVTINDARFLRGSRLWAGNNSTLRGAHLRVLAPQSNPLRVVAVYNGSKGVLNIYSALEGGSARGILIEDDRQNANGLVGLKLFGDCSAYAGLIDVKTNAILKIANAGLPNATVWLQEQAKGLATEGAAQDATIAKLKTAAAGAIISVAKDETLTLNEIELGGKVTKTGSGILYVPTTVDIAANFTIEEGKVLHIGETPSTTRAGLLIIFR